MARAEELPDVARQELHLLGHDPEGIDGGHVALCRARDGIGDDVASNRDGSSPGRGTWPPRVEERPRCPKL